MSGYNFIYRSLNVSIKLAWCMFQKLLCILLVYRITIESLSCTCSRRRATASLSQSRAREGCWTFILLLFCSRMPAQRESHSMSFLASATRFIQWKLSARNAMAGKGVAASMKTIPTQVGSCAIKILSGTETAHVWLLTACIACVMQDKPESHAFHARVPVASFLVVAGGWYPGNVRRHLRPPQRASISWHCRGIVPPAADHAWNACGHPSEDLAPRPKN